MEGAGEAQLFNTRRCRHDLGCGVVRGVGVMAHHGEPDYYVRLCTTINSESTTARDGTPC